MSLRRIYVNAAASYARSIVALVLGLFAVRWVLSALGPENYGLYTVIAALIAFSAFLNYTLTMSTARCYAFALGTCQGMDATSREAVLRGWFNTALLVHVGVVCALVAVGWPVGEWVVRRFVNIPSPDRLGACVLCFRFALLTAVVQFVYIPFQAMYTARQHISLLAGFGVVMNALSFGAAALLARLPGDLLVWHGGMSAAILSGVPILASVWACVKFPCCRLDLAAGRDRARCRELMRFSGWTLLGSFGWLLATQGGVFVTNRIFGPVANAAYGISQQMQNQAEALSNSLMGAFAPEFSTQAGSGDCAATARLSLACGRLGFLLFAFLAVPLALELPTVLKMWLGTPPAGVVAVCRIMLAAYAVHRLTMGTQLALNASGRIARWQIVSGIVHAVTVPVAVGLAWWQWGMTSAAVAFLGTTAVASAVCAWYGWREAGVSLRGWGREVLVPALLTVSLAGVCGYGMTCVLPPSFGRICATGVVTSLVFAVPILRARVGGARVT